MISLPRSLIAIEAWGSSCTTVVIASLVVVNGYFHGDRPVGLNESANVTSMTAHFGGITSPAEGLSGVAGTSVIALSSFAKVVKAGEGDNSRLWRDLAKRKARRVQFN
jgi:hypothetical protein